MIFRLNDDDIEFPDPNLAEEDGLLAVGGDLSSARLMKAYRLGIFPWYSDNTPILWYSPHRRFVLFPEKLRISKSMRKILRDNSFQLSEDKAFPDVIRSCASVERKDQDGTWIVDDMQEAYIRLHKAGFAHSVEVWQDDVLAGGLYGLSVGAVFCGESMFSKVSNASKVALIWLCQHKNYRMIDCQVYTEHLSSLGAEYISREEYMDFLNSEFP